MLSLVNFSCAASDSDSDGDDIQDIGHPGLTRDMEGQIITFSPDAANTALYADAYLRGAEIDFRGLSPAARAQAYAEIMAAEVDYYVNDLGYFDKPASSESAEDRQQYARDNCLGSIGYNPGGPPQHDSSTIELLEEFDQRLNEIEKTLATYKQEYAAQIEAMELIAMKVDRLMSQLDACLHPAQSVSSID